MGLSGLKMNLDSAANSKARVANVRLSFFAKSLLIIIALYRKLLSPFLVSSCRFLPTCSEYTAEAIVKYGAIRGMLMGLKRILKCHPFGGNGYDPVP